MHRKLAATLAVAIFVLSSIAVFTPASAHFTLGDYRSGFDYHVNDFDGANVPPVDQHVTGPMGYVWPGSGLAAFAGDVNGAPPGYQSPWPSDNPPGQQQSVYQLEGNAYAPFGAILTSTDDHSNRGPLIFAFNFSCPFLSSCTQTFDLFSRLNFTGLTIYIPPEFDLSSAKANAGLVASTWGTTASDYSLVTTDMNDPIGPGWWALSFEGNIRFWPEHGYDEWYYLRINDVGAPKIAGKYFFKMFLWDTNRFTRGFQMVVPGSWNVDSVTSLAEFGQSTTWVPTSGPTYLTFPVENWPVLLVKGEVDPGIVYGTIRYGTFNQTLYGRPINFPGMVDMVGTGIDPYLPDHPSTGRPVQARGYFNASAAGHYEVEGVAPGVYTIYAQAAGYPRQTLAENVVILPGQSFQMDGYLQPGAVVHGQIFSKHLFGEESWPVNPRPVSIVLFSSNDYAQKSIVAWSPWNKTHSPFTAYDWGQGYSTPEPLPVAYPWDTVTAGVAPSSITPFSYYNQFFPSPPAAPTLYRSHPAVTCGGNFDPCGKPDGVGPAQYWWVDQGGVFTNGGGANSFIYRFGVKGVYGAPKDIDGHIPQPYATWINGLTAGRYFVRAFLNGYVQTLQDGVTLDEASFEVSAQEWAGDVYLPMDLRVSSLINKTVHFHDQPGTLDECPIRGCAGNVAEGQALGDRYLIAEVRDSEGVLYGWNFTRVSVLASHASIQINGFGLMGPDPNANYFGGAGMKYFPYRYRGYSDGPPDRGTHDYGLPSGTYTVKVYMRGYVQQTLESISVTLSGSPALISNHMYRGARFNVTIYSIDWEHPRINRPWEFPSAEMAVYIYKDAKTSYGSMGGRNQPAGLDGVLIAGTCNLATIPGVDFPDHCYIISWDGFRDSDTLDLYPDRRTSATQFSGYGDFDAFLGKRGFLWNGGVAAYRFSAKPYASYNAIESGTYFFYAWTYGYLQHKQYSAYVMKGGYGDIKVNLLQGVNITLNIPFKKEGIYSPTEANMSMRVRVFDDEGRLVATAQSKVPDSQVYNNDGVAVGGDPNDLGIGRWHATTGYSSAGGYTYYVDPFAQSPARANGLTSIDGSTATADTFLWFGDYYGTGAAAWQAFDSDVNHDGSPDFSYFNPRNQYRDYYTWIPAHTSQVRVFIAGTFNKGDDPLNSLFSKVLKGRTLDGLRDQGPYGIPGSSSTIPEGIPVSYSGKYFVEVDTWNEYPAPSFGRIITSSSTDGLDFTPPFIGFADGRNWYPPVEGLLEGDSFHTIPGASPDVFGFTGDTLAANGLGPYAQRMVWEVPNGHLGSEVSVVYELDKRGYISGNIYGFTWSDELRPFSWGTVVFASAAGNLTFTSYSWDAFYDGYLDPGQYEMSVIAWSPAGQAYTVVKAPVTISDGQSTTGVTFQLERSNIPIPEFSGLAIVFVSALAASLYVLRCKRQ